MQISIRPSAGVDALYAPRRYLLDRILVDAAVEAGAEVLHETRVVDLLRDDTGRVTGVVTSDSAATSQHHGRPGHRRRRYPLGRGPQRRRGHACVRADWAGAVQYAYFSGVEATGYQWAYGNGAGAGMIPTNDGQPCGFVSTAPERMRSLRPGRTATEMFDVLWRLAAPRLADRLHWRERASRQHGWAASPDSSGSRPGPAGP